MTCRVRLVTCVEGELETRLVELVGTRGELEVARRCADLAEVLAAAGAGAGTVVLLSAGVPGLDRVITADLRRRGMCLLGVHDTTGADEDQVRQRFAAVGIDEVHRVGDAAALATAVLVCDGSAGPIVADSDTLWQELEPPAWRGHVVTVWGPTGAPGRSTVAATLAARLARGGCRVLLVDADTYGASLGQLMGVVDETPGLPAACRAAHTGTLTAASLATLAPQVLPGLQILTGVPAPDRWPEVSETGLEQVLTTARRVVEVVVVDAGFCLEADDTDGFGPRRNGATLTALDEADAVVAVGTADPVGLGRSVRGGAELAQATGAPVVTVANRVRRAVTGSHGQDQIETLLGVEGPGVVMVGEDPTASAALAIDGASALAAPGRGPLADGMNEVVARLIGLGLVQGPSAAGVSHRRRRWGGLRPGRTVARRRDVVDSSS